MLEAKRIFSIVSLHDHIVRVYEICIGVNGIEDTGSRGGQDKELMQRKKYENIAAGICFRNAAFNTQKYYEGKQ